MSVTCALCSYENTDRAIFCESCGGSLGDGAGAGALIGKLVLGTYELVDLLGKGGMSVVYLAKHQLTEQEVAIKVLPPELARQRELKARFIEEARALARLEHPNIVVLHNFSEEDGNLYLVMQYAEGETFDHIISQEGRVPLGDVVDVAAQVLRALEYAHEQGVVHRDIKPSNIIVRGDGSVKVMDFGLAKYTGSSKLTQTGLTMGTVRYMSPEQVRGRGVDHRSDLYSLGVALYEGLAGRTPFDGGTHFEIMQQHLSAQPAPITDFVAVPAEMQNVLSRAMAKRVENRYQSAREFRHALQAVPREAPRRRRPVSESVAPLPRPSHAGASRSGSTARRRWPAILASVAVLACGAAVVWALYTEPGTKGPARTPAADPPRTKKLATQGPPTAAAWPALHKVAAGITGWKVDRRFVDRAPLRILATTAVDAAALRQLYLAARDAYPAFLSREGITVDVKPGPLNLAIVEQSVLNNPANWPDVKPNTDYPTRYEATAATLYVHNGPGYAKTDLPYGLAIHFCVRIDRLTNARCLELAEDFEKYFSSTARR